MGIGACPIQLPTRPQPRIRRHPIVFEEHDLLGAAHRLVPWQHDHARTEAYVRVASPHPRQVLHGVGREEVVGEVMLDGPQGIEPEIYGEIGQSQLVGVDLCVGCCVPRVLKPPGYPTSWAALRTPHGLQP